MDCNYNFRRHYSQIKKKGKARCKYVVVSFNHGLNYNFRAWGIDMFTSLYRIAIERSRYVTLPW